MDRPVRTRFAPSPTGFLHVGGVRTALYNYLWAKQKGGQFILRLEDTDRERFVAEGIDQIVEGLAWLDLKPDEGFWINRGKHQNIEFVQSERHKSGLYQKYADRLIAEGVAYRSYIAPEKYAEYKKDSAGRPFIYRKSMEGEHHAGLAAASPAGKYPIRLDVAAVRQKFQDLAGNGLTWRDEVRGEFVEDLALIEDFILIKSDGYPTYNFANVIDDHEMSVSYVIRGDEFIASTGKHALLYELFSWGRPKFVHLSVINGPDGKKLSKRTGDTNVLDYRDKGYLPEALINFLALLGWNDGTEQEIFSRDELVQKFGLKGINTSPAVFDQKRLDWMNGHYIRSLPLEELAARAEPFWGKAARAADAGYKKAVLTLIQDRLKHLDELPELTNFFFDEPSTEQVKSLFQNPTDKLLNGHTLSDLKVLLAATIDKLEVVEDFSPGPLQSLLNELLDSLHTKPGVLLPVIRIAISGASFSPEIAHSLSVLGRDQSLARLRSAAGLLDSPT